MKKDANPLGLNGILVVDKPAGFTSFDVVAKLRGMFKTRKIGHGGTLDPMATGVLPVFVGPAVKAVDLAPNQDKAYDAVMRLGVRTDTGDITGAVLETAAVAVAEGDIRAVLPRFLGPQQQLPPLYSAVKVAGQPLYKYARQGQQVQRKPRPVVVHNITLLGPQCENEWCLQVVCGKGTYIRTLLEDIGAAVGAPATLAGLRRTQAGVFGIEQAHSLSEIQAAADEGRLEALLCPVEQLFAALPAVQVEEKALARLQNGAPVYRVAGCLGRCRIRCGVRFIGLGQLDEEGTLKSEKLFLPPAGTREEGDAG
ncbi:tRNA pseudouridine(55) synthase TruB [Ruminococcaceae bacterium OttesenSCG-928-O06]|nr:tRNA pseudouridine(55) synthase TruB [Ruminococcaceae bacterium OttesenSCG-928-O06]